MNTKSENIEAAQKAENLFSATLKEGKIQCEMIIALAAIELGWNISVEKSPPGGIVRGIIVGTPEYIDHIFRYHPKKDKEDDQNQDQDQDDEDHSNFIRESKQEFDQDEQNQQDEQNE